MRPIIFPKLLGPPWCLCLLPPEAQLQSLDWHMQTEVSVSSPSIKWDF